MSIQQYLDKIKNAVYGREVRGAIHDAIKQTYDDASRGGDANMEVSMARGGFRTLNERLTNVDGILNSVNQQLAQKASKTDLSYKRDKSVAIGINDLSSEVLEAIEGGEGTSFNLLSIPRDNSVTFDKISHKTIGNEKIADYIGEFSTEDFEIGSLHINTGNPIADDTRIRTKDFIKGFRGFIIKCTDPGIQLSIRTYNPDDQSFISSSNWIYEYTVEEDSLIKIIMRYTDDRVIDDVEDIADLVFSINHNGTGISSDKLSKNAVTTEKVEDKAISLKKTSFLNVDDIIFQPLYNYGFDREGRFIYAEGALTYRAYIRPYEKVILRAFNHDRFQIGVRNTYNQRIYDGSDVGSAPMDKFEAYSGISELEFKNDAYGKELYFYVKSSSWDRETTATIESFRTKLNDYKLQSSSVETKVNTELTADVYPVMFGVKMSNERDFTARATDVPRPVGWLYYHPETYELFYASGSPDNMKKLCDWDFSVTWTGSNPPMDYSPFITKKGDIVFVWRGYRLGVESTNEINPDGRQNPIVYPAGDYENPVEVDLGDGVKPTAWLQNSGVDYIYNKNILIFSEYTRPLHGFANVWKVTEPITDPNNWKRTLTLELSGDKDVGLKHFHTAEYDPFSGKFFVTTGDDDQSSKIYMSSDDGDTWEVVLEGDRSYTRVLNFIFTKDRVYWASDDYNHYFNCVERDENGVPDFANPIRLYDMRGYPPTYISCLIDNPYGIMFLNRHDVPQDDPVSPIDILFWDIEKEEMITLDKIYPSESSRTPEGRINPYGFRADAASYYHPKGDNRIVVGFGDPVNGMDVLNNYGWHITETVNNLTLEVTKVGEEYGVKIAAITNRT